MSTTRPKLAAAKRDVTGKAVATLRRSGRLPAVVFGRGIESTSVSIDAHEFELLRRHIGSNTLIDLSVDGERATPVLVHGVQRHRIDQHPLHVDLYQVRMTDELVVDVPLVATGESEAVKVHGGTLLHPTEHVKVKALPDHLPQSIHYSVDGLATFDDMVHVRDLAIPSDVTLLTDGDEIVARVLPPRVEEEPTPAPVEAEAEAGAAAEAPTADGAPAGESSTES